MQRASVWKQGRRDMQIAIQMSLSCAAWLGFTPRRNVCARSEGTSEREKEEKLSESEYSNPTTVSLAACVHGVSKSLMRERGIESLEKNWGKANK